MEQDNLGLFDVFRRQTLLVMPENQKRGYSPAMQKPSFPLAVVMQWRRLHHPWVEGAWEAWSVLPGERGETAPRILVEEPDLVQWLYPGFRLVLHRDESAGYHFNLTAQSPRVFVLWREDDERGVPVELTVSFDEASRWADGGHSIDGVAMPAQIFAWVGRFVEENYRPEPEERQKPRSFQRPERRF